MVICEGHQPSAWLHMENEVWYAKYERSDNSIPFLDLDSWCTIKAAAVVLLGVEFYY